MTVPSRDEGNIVGQTNIQTVSTATPGKLLREGGAHVGFLNRQDTTLKSAELKHRRSLSTPVDTASALLSLQKVCGLWTLSCDFVHRFLLKH